MSKCSHHQHHHHSHKHHHHSMDGGTSSQKSLGWVFFLNLSFAVLELIGGFYFNSVAVMSDALHDFGDALAVGISVILEKISHKKRNTSYTYGYRRFSVLGALITGLILLGGSVAVLSQAIPRLLQPQAPQVNGMILMACLGVLVNGYAAFKISKGSSLNERMLWWHMMEDLMGWILVLGGAFIIKWTQLYFIDALLGVLLSLWVSYNVLRTLKEVVQVFLMASPSSLSLDEIILEMKREKGVQNIHHAHLWSLDGDQSVFTGHVLLEQNIGSLDCSSLKRNLKSRLQKIGIFEATLELEFFDEKCGDPDCLTGR